jgi:hypothetical protein
MLMDYTYAMTSESNERDNVPVKVLIGTMQYKLEMTVADDPSQLATLVSAATESSIYIKYEVIVAPPLNDGVN